MVSCDLAECLRLCLRYDVRSFLLFFYSFPITTFGIPDIDASRSILSPYVLISGVEYDAFFVWHRMFPIAKRGSTGDVSPMF
jgi:hypothetical protein